MYRRLLWLIALAAALFAASAFAAPRDNAALKKIDEAINQHYLATSFDKAEAILTGTIKACGAKCSGPVIAKAWMYVGIVRGSGKADIAGATEAFQQALSIDPKVSLDNALATDDTKKAFADAAAAVGANPSEGGSGGTGGGTEPPPDKPARPAAGAMDCQPRITEVDTRRPIPISCTSEEDATAAELKYKEFGGEKWVTLKMQKKGDAFVAEIPCTATQVVGALKFYVRARDAAGDTIDNYGTKREPVEISVVNATDQEAPSFPDQDPPNRCAEEVECPPGMPGCGASKRGDKGWGATCEETRECQSGLVCMNGTCETGGQCTADSDCSGGATCVDGECSGGGGGGSGKAHKFWLGAEVGFDLAFLTGDDVCSQQSQADEGFACFLPGTEDQYTGDPQPAQGNKISGGFALGTVRFMLHPEYFLTKNISLGARVGYAINGGPTPEGGNAFLPFHAEARATYWLGDSSALGLRPFLHLGGGVAQVDASLTVTISDCSQLSGTAQQACKDGKPTETAPPAQLDAYKKLGQGFGGLGGGAMYAMTDSLGLVLDVNIMFMLPSSGQVIEPSLGIMKGF
ncbi:MAG: hypothetical protein KC766_29070 [Myxococcales bacterium]|nr:hypothetical protein [Myxococcales bacterium]